MKYEILKFSIVGLALAAAAIVGMQLNLWIH